MALEYSFIQIDVELAITDEPIVISAPKLIIFATDDAAALFRVDDVTADQLPVRGTLEICAPDGEVISKIFVTSAGTAVAGDTIDIAVINSGNINLFG